MQRKERFMVLKCRRSLCLFPFQGAAEGADAVLPKGGGFG